MSYQYAGLVTSQAIINFVGHVQVGTSVVVYNPGTTTATTLYTDKTKGTTTSNPFTTNAQGNIPVRYAVPGDYDLVLTVDGVAQPAIRIHVRPDASEPQLSNAAGKPATGDAVVFVSTSGNDSNDGLSWGSAKLTIAAAITALPSGGLIEVGAGDFSFSSTLTPASRTIIRGRGFGGTSTQTTRLLFGGSSGTYAFDLTGNERVKVEELKVECTVAGGRALLLGDTTNLNRFTRVFFKGASAAAGTGIVFTGQLSCSCHTTFDQCQFSTFATLVKMSGFANSNLFENCHFSNAVNALDISATGTDTMGGSNNLFNRCEFDSGLTGTVITVGTGANNNAFIKCAQDGIGGAAYSIAASTQTLFVGCVLGAGGSPAADTVFLGCADGGSYRAIKLGNSVFTLTTSGILATNLGVSVGGYAGSNASSTGLGVFGTSEFSGGLFVGGYAGSNRSSTGLGVFGNSEFSNALHVGGLLSLDAATPLKITNASALVTTATAGAQTLPANPVGFVVFQDSGGTTRKIPYYAN